jgi:lipid A ethanolaminephosphotransferase
LKIEVSTNQAIIGSALLNVALANLAFFRNLLQAFGAEPRGYVHIASLAVLLLSVTILLLSILSLARAIKPLFTVFFMLSAATAYFMDTYNVIIDHDMIANAAQTNPAESLDLLTPRFLLYLLLLGALPSLVLWKTRIRHESIGRSLRQRGVLMLIVVLGTVGLVFLSSGFYASFIREHKSLRYYTNPVTPIHGVIRYVQLQLKDDDKPLKVIGEDAQLPATDAERELVIMVVGETARSDRFSLNGYARETNPLLKQETVASLRNVSACGTSTAISVPCMFAIYGHDEFSDDRARSTENLLDILKHAKVNLLWRDNNSDSKGVAKRVPFQDFRSPKVNTVCDTECRDEGMLAGLQAFIDSHPSGDILIVLHHMGSHGPAYYRRYPESFRRFQPTCETSQLDACTPQEIGNTYDNTILYTDYFLSRVIGLLRDNDAGFETAMVYVSDHGESLGEGGLYLHGLPYFVAPESQTRVPVVFWFGRNFDGASIAAMQQLTDRPYSHDNVFHTLLGLFEIETGVYDPALDILRDARAIEGRDREHR